MHPKCVLGKDEASFKVDQKVYRGLIGTLLYINVSRPTYCLVYAYVLDFSQVLEKLTLQLLRRSLVFERNH